MRIKVVSSTDLAIKPWGAVHHFPAEPTADGRRPVAAFELTSKIRQAHPDEADPQNWSDAESLFREQAERRTLRAG